MVLKVLVRLSSGELRTEFSKISDQDVFIYSESLAIVVLTMHLKRNGQDPFHFQFECDSQIIESVNEFVDESAEDHDDESVNEFVDESVKEHDDERVNKLGDEIVKYHVDESVNEFVDESINLEVHEYVEGNVEMSVYEDLEGDVGDFETVEVIILKLLETTVVPVSGLPIVTDSSSVSSLIQPSLAFSLNTLAITLSSDMFLRSFRRQNVCEVSERIYDSNEGKKEFWPPDQVSSYCTIRDGISLN